MTAQNPGRAHKAEIPSLGIPAIAELAARDQWVLWKYIPNVGKKPRKVPLQPDGREASTADPSTWSSFATACEALARGAGVGLGFVFTAEDPYAGVDLDACLSESRPTDLAVEVVSALDSYAEKSPSNTGLHVIVKGRLPAGWRKRDDLGLEIYSEGRYFAMTGREWPDGRDTIEERGSALAALHAKFAPGPKQKDRAEEAQDDGRAKLREGTRHAALKKRLVALRHKGLSAAELLGAGLAFNRDRCEPPKPDEEIEKLVAWVLETIPAASEPLPPIHCVTAAEFESDVIPDAVVERLVHEASNANCNGGSKTGKTFVALQMGMCVATGTLFLGLETRKSVVLYICLEMTCAMVRKRMEAIARDTDVPMPTIGESFHLVAPTRGRDVAVSLLSDGDAERLIDLIQRLGAKFVVLDTLYKFIPGLDPSDNGEMGPVFARIAHVATVTDAAMLTLDHVPKGALGSGVAAHSGLGAVVKGGAARTIVHLQRTQREDGGRWQLDVDSHFGSWDEPLHFMRPRRADGECGDGVVRCSALEGRGLDRERVRRLFDRCAGRDEKGRPHFHSQTQMIEAAQGEGLITANSTSGGTDFVRALKRDLAIHFDANPSREKNERPVWYRPLGTAKNAPVEFVWVASLEPQEDGEE